MSRPTKTIFLGGKSYSLTGLSETDHYFRTISEDVEEEFVTFCRHHVAEDAVCLDIGANIGLKTICLSHMVPRGTVVAVEAGAEIAELLDFNVQANQLRNVQVVRGAVGDADGEISFFAESAYGHIADDGSEGSAMVPLRRLSTLLAEQGLDRVDFIKLDVEGFEFPILRDALDLIDEHRAVVLLEFNSWCQLAYAGVNPREFMEWLFENFVYVARLGRQSQGGQLLEHVQKEDAMALLHHNLVLDRCVTDLVATNHPERLDPTPRALMERLDAAEQERDDAVRERAAAIAAIDAATRERDELAVARDALTRDRDALRASHSWRITAPLRALSGLRIRARGGSGSS